MNIASRRNFMNKNGMSLYIEGTGTQYIDLGVKLNQDSAIELDFKIIQPGNYNVFGSRTSATENNIQIIFSSEDNLIAADFQNWMDNRLDVPTFYRRTTVRISRNTLFIGNLSKQVVKVTNFETPYNAYVFDVSGNKISNFNRASMRLYGCKISQNNQLIRDCIPMLDDDNIPCLFDKVSGQCFYNQGTGQFLYGR